MKSSKRFLLAALILALSSIIFGQYTTVDFEPGGLGADWAWTVGENAANPPLQFPANPVSGGINTSATVAHFTALAGGNPWALCFTPDMENFQFNATNSIVKIMVYKPRISPVGIKFEGGSAPMEIQISNTLINQWEELTFDFSGAIGNTYGTIVIIPDFLARTQDYQIYFDNIRIPAPNIAPPAVPTVAAPTPTAAQANVISLFSNAYTNVPVDTWSAGWDIADVADVLIAGNATKLYTNLTFAGIEFTSNTINATNMTHFNMDIWTPDATAMPAAFRIKLVDFGANGVWSGGDDVEHELVFNASSTPPLVSNNWISYHIPLTAFTGLVTKAHLAQLIISGDPNTVYVDNIYFSMPGNASAVATLSDLRVNNVTVAGFAPTTYSYNMELPWGTPIPTVSATATDANASVAITQAAAIPGSATVLVTAQDAVTTLSYTVNFIYGPTYPTVAPPEPIHDSEDVISIYSDYYGNVPGVDLNPYWGQQTIVTVDYQVGGVNTVRYQNLNYQGTQYPNQDVSSYEAIHLNYWTANSTNLQFFLISPGLETPYTLPITAGQWMTVDIPVRYFTPPVNLSNVFQFKVVGNGDVWFANLFFWKEPTQAGSDATLADLKVNGVTVPGFAPLTENYSYGLLEGTVTPPQITSVTLTDPAASYIITQAAGIPGTATVVVTAANNTTTKTYSVAFRVTTPNSVPPVPVEPAANVISLFSDAYPNVVVDTWLTPWSQGTYEQVMVAGNAVKKYTNVNFVGIETVGANLLDLSEMEYVHIDIWSPDTNPFRIKLVDWGPDGNWSGGDDTEHEISSETPPVSQWASYDIPLSAFTNLNITGHMAQYILSKPTLGTLYIDNFYFYKMGTPGPANVAITRIGNLTSVSWDAVPGASYYTVYQSNDPYGTFVPVVGGTYNGTSWITADSAGARFYHVTAHFE